MENDSNWSATGLLVNRQYRSRAHDVPANFLLQAQKRGTMSWKGYKLVLVVVVDVLTSHN